MNALSGPLYASAVLLVIGGASKVLRPGNTVHALRALRAPVGPLAVRLLAVTEMAIGVGALVGGGRLVWLLVGASYLGFACFVLFAMARGAALSSCGCFGGTDTAPTLTHVVVTVSASALAFATVFGPPPGPALDSLGDQPLLDLTFVLLTGCCVWFAYAAIAVLPRTAAFSRKRTSSGAS